ncbi:RING finger protein 112-like isoform 1-T4 [Discoglossus pictus]
MAHVGGPSGAISLEDDIMCSVCYSDLSDPVSVTCGHTFCRKCITHYWNTVQSRQYQCPECRVVCDKDQLIPAHRLRSLISKAQLIIKEEQSRKVTPGRAIQLAYTDENGHLKLSESAIESCFLMDDTSGYPMCLISVIGEKRRGKSFLMNYILRALHSQEQRHPLNLGLDDEPLQGFQWKTGANPTTEGIWIWSRPFILEQNRKQIAVYVLDMESFLDRERDEQTCLKLAALSITLSSYLIFNIHSTLKTKELNFLEIYLQISELMGKSFIQQEIKHLDILVRDWHNCNNYGRKAAWSYIEQEEEKLLSAPTCPLVSIALRSSFSSCHLLPHPGPGMIRSNLGRLVDMNEDFRSYLTIYVSEMVRGIWRHIKTDSEGKTMTSGQLGKILKVFGGLFEKEHFSFSSPLEISYTFENSVKIKNVKKKFEEFLNKQATSISTPFKLLGARPTKVRSRIYDEAMRLVMEFDKTLKGCYGRRRQLMVDEMMSILLQEQEVFCADYDKRFKKCAAKCVLGAGVVGLIGGVSGAVMAGTVLASGAAAVVSSVVGGTLTLRATGGGEGLVRHMEDQRDQNPDKGAWDPQTRNTN